MQEWPDAWRSTVGFHIRDIRLAKMTYNLLTICTLHTHTERQRLQLSSVKLIQRFQRPEHSVDPTCRRPKMDKDDTNWFQVNVFINSALPAALPLDVIRNLWPPI